MVPPAAPIDAALARALGALRAVAPPHELIARLLDALPREDEADRAPPRGITILAAVLAAAMELAAIEIAF